MVVRGNTKKPIQEPMKEIEKKGELSLLGLTFHKLPCNWDTHFDHIIHSKASSRLYTLRVCNIMDTLYRSSHCYLIVLLCPCSVMLLVWATGGDSSNKGCFGRTTNLFRESGDFAGNRETWAIFREI